MSIIEGSLSALPRYNQFVSDTFSAIGASFFVAPLITIIDRSIILNASGAKPLRSGLKDGISELLLKPHKFIQRPEFLMTWALYYVTYQTAHTISSVCENQMVDAMTPRFIGTMIVNPAACVAKDRAFTRMFGVKAPSKLPMSTYGLFFARDCATIFASFSLPPLLTDHISKNYDISPDRARTVAQLACPVGIQFFSTPLHLIGLNLYNVQSATLAERLGAIASQYTGSTLARCSRIFPAFGIGGELSRRFRNGLREYTGVLRDLSPKKISI